MSYLQAIYEVKCKGNRRGNRIAKKKKRKYSLLSPFSAQNMGLSAFTTSTPSLQKLYF